MVEVCSYSQVVEVGLFLVEVCSYLLEVEVVRNHLQVGVQECIWKGAALLALVLVVVF